MENSQKKNGMHWLLILIVIAGVVLLLTTVLNNPSAEGTKDALAPAEDVQQVQPEPPPSEVEVADSVKPTEPVIQPIPLDDPLREPPKKSVIASSKPLYFRMVFGENGTDSTLGVIDESGGTGTGYNIAYVDENRNSDLTDDTARQFERDSRSDQTNPTFAFSGPFKNKTSAKYTLNIYSLTRKKQHSPGDYRFWWNLYTDGWNYFFINGKIRLSSSVVEAQAGPPIRLAGPCTWQIESARKSNKTMVCAGLEDENGCTLRSVIQTREWLSPKLTLVKNGKIELEEDMKFG